MRIRRRRGDRELTLVFTDLAGFSTWALRAGDDAAVALLREVTAVVEPVFVAHRGRVVKRLGDGLMATFSDPQAAFDAVQAARAGVAALQVEGHRPRLRAGLHTGRPRQVRGDYLGVDVNIAARLVERAGPDEVLVSDTALAGLDASRVSARRKKTFLLTVVKGVPPGMAVYAVTPVAARG